MPSPGCSIIVAAKGFIIREGRALILRRSPENRAGPGMWEFAGGQVEFGETLEQALSREILEETGLTATPGPLLFADSGVVSPGRQVVILCYLCGVPSTDVVLSPEHDAYRWVTQSEMMAVLDTRVAGDLAHGHVFTNPAFLAAGLLP